MAGRNQHHIPQFLQRGFAIEGSNKNKIWRFDKEREPAKPRSIRRTASEDYFYSEPSPDGSRTLDDEITDQEQSVACALSKLRSAKVDTEISPDVAAEVVGHFVPRTAHCRQAFEYGARESVAGVEELFFDSDYLQELMGTNLSAPNDIFRSLVTEELHKNKVAVNLGLPDHVVERMAFYLAKEQFKESFKTLAPVYRKVFSLLKNNVGHIIRTSHNNALIKLGPHGARNDLTRTMTWKVAASPKEGAILPDCVVLALNKSGLASPLIFATTNETVAIVMPLSTKALLLGTKGDFSLPQEFNYNQKAARSSHRFFLAATNSAAIAALQPLIDEYPSAIISDAVLSAKNKHKPIKSADCIIDSGSRQPIIKAVESAAKTFPSYHFSFLGCADESDAYKVNEVVKEVVSALIQWMSLGRFEYITFASDYAAALQNIDRGEADWGPPTTVDEKTGVGIAQTVNLVRGGIVKCHIVMDAVLARALIAKDDKLVDWAISGLVRQLCHVALVEVMDEALPGGLLQPIQDPLQRWLYGSVHGATEEYVAAHICAGLGDPEEVADTSRQLLAEALDRMREEVLPARLDYRYSGALNDLLALTMPSIRHVLLFAASLLGHCTSSGMEPAPLGGALAEALERAGLSLWLSRFNADLEINRLRFGQWKSVDEFLALTVHVERLMWQLGMIPWGSDKGIRVKIPIGSDAEALMADLKATGHDNK